MGTSLAAYGLLAASGLWMRQRRRHRQPVGNARTFHLVLGSALVGLTLLLFAIGIVGTLGHFGSLGHSIHLPAGLAVVSLVGLSAWSAARISARRPWARPVHLATNAALLFAFAAVLTTGWRVVQKYLPP
jgi:hypothetical protein